MSAPDFGTADVLERLDDTPNTIPYMSGFSPSAETVDEIMRFQPQLFKLNTSAAESEVNPAEYPSGWAIEADDEERIGAKVTGRVFTISALTLARIKSMATGPEADDTWISTFEALSAFLYQTIFRARHRIHHRTSRADFLTSFNARRRLGLSDRYFGNMPICVTTHLEPAELEQWPLWRVARHLHDLIRDPSTDGQSVRSTLEWIQVQPNKRRVMQDFLLGSGSFMTAQWSGFDVYGAVFDVEPTVVGEPFTATNLVDGLLKVLPSEDRTSEDAKRALSCNLSLAVDVWQELEQDEVFQR